LKVHVRGTLDTKYDQGVQEDYPMHCYDERYEIIATPVSNKFK